MLFRPIARLAQTSTASLRPTTAMRFAHTELDQSRQSGHEARAHSGPLDAASSQEGKQAARGGLSGNQEGVGFAEQVGSQSASGSNIHGSSVGKPESAEGKSGQENITPPSFVDAVKEKLGLGTTAREAKQNRGGGKGVTGTGQVTVDSGKRTMHTSAVSMADKTKGQAPAASRQPKENTHSDQNAHLKHKKAGAADTGKGNAAENPTLPSRQAKDKGTGKSPARGFSTSAYLSAEKHTADHYFKDVDSSNPPNPKVHQVDDSGAAAPVARANEHPATGEFSREGSQTPAYDTASKHNQPYDTQPTQGSESDQKLRYGGVPGLSKPSKADEGPEGKNAGGRKPEGRS